MNATGKTRKTGILLADGVCLLALAGAAIAQVGASYDLSFSTVDGGGGTAMDGGTYSLVGTVGQADAGTVSDGSTYALEGGFWNGGRTLVPVELSGFEID